MPLLLRVFCSLTILSLATFSCEKSLDKENNRSENLAGVLLEIGIKEYKIGNFEKADSVFRKIIAETPIKDNEQIIIRTNTNLGNIYADKGNNPASIQYYNKALLLAESIKDKKNTAHLQKNIGTLYVSWKQFDKALDFYDKALKTSQLIKDETLTADCYNNIGIIYEQQEKFENATEVYNKALVLYEKTDMKEGIAMAESNLAIVYKLQKKYDLSLEHNKKALKVSEEINDKWTTAATLNNIGNLYREMKNYPLATEYASRGLKLAQEMDAKEIIIMAYETLALSASESGDYKKAFELHRKFSEVNDAFINIESTKQFSDLQVKYDTEKKEKDLTKTKLELTKKELSSKQKNIWLILLGSLILIGLVIFRNYSVKSKLKQKQLYLKNELLQEQSNAKIQEQRLEISRELHDSLGSQLTFINSILDGLKTTSEKLDKTLSSKLNKLSEFSENSITELKNTIWVLNSKELKINELRMKILNFISDASEAKEEINFHFDFDVAKDIQLNSKQAINLFRVFQEIVNNAMKYSDAKDISIVIKQIENQINIQISDNGIGFDFEKEKNKSFGLTNIQNRISELGGTLSVETSAGNGTKYNIEVKVL